MECRELGKYTLLDHMGKGGVASVYRANDNEAGVVLAIKVFEPSERRPLQMVRKLRDREVRMLISIQHPNVVKYYDSGETEDAYYYTMEFVEDTLYKRMRDERGLELSDRIHILRQVCNALQAIHHQGIVHRDIKPANILLDQAPNGAFHVKVTDLGIAKRVSEIKEVRAQHKSSRVPGTPKYLSPEQINLQPLDGRADVFSLGIVAYELLAGAPPFAPDDTDGYLQANLNEEPPPLHQAAGDLPSFLTPVVRKMLAKDREERYDSDTLTRDMELVYQHLISGADLKEKRNSESVFYDSELPPPVRVHRRMKARPAAAKKVKGLRIRIAGTAAAAAAALLYVVLGWPDKPAPEPPAEAPGLVAGWAVPAAEALEKAADHIDAGSYWTALVLLHGIRHDALDRSNADRWDEMTETVQNALAEPFIETALKKLQEGELEETERLLAEIQFRFPQASDADGVAGRVQEYRLNREDMQHWLSEINALQNEIEAGSWTEALVKAQDALEKYAGRPERVSRLNDGIVEILNGWQRELIEGEPEPAPISHCIDVVENYLGREPFAGRINDERASLFLQMGEYFRRADNYEIALEWFRRTLDEFPDDPAATMAEDRIAELASAGKFLPADVAVFQDYLRQYRFSGHMWAEDVPENGWQETDEGILVMGLDGARETSVNRRRLIRPLAPYAGFEISFDFRFKAELSPPEGRVGVKIRDGSGNSMELFFDGQNYQDRRFYYWSGRTMSGGSTIRQGFSDEDEAWHNLKLSYQFDTGRLSLFVDGEAMRDYRLEFDNLFITLFLEAPPNQNNHAAFRNLKIGLP